MVLLKKSDGFFKKLQKTNGNPDQMWDPTNLLDMSIFFKNHLSPAMGSNPFPWNGLGQILGCGFASQQGRVERQLQVTHRNLGFGYPGAYDA